MTNLNNTTRATTMSPNMSAPYGEEVMSNHEVNKMFKFKANEVIDASSIVIEGIEHKSSGFIAGRLTAALEKEGVLVQALGMDEKGKADKDYHFKCTFDVKTIGMTAVQLSGVLPLIDIPMDLETVAGLTFVWKNFYRIARSNASTIHYPGDMNKAYWVERATEALLLAEKAHLLTRGTDDLVIRSDRYLSTCVSRTGIAHQTNAITDDNRRKERVKLNFNPKKDGTSQEVRDTLEFIESQGQMVNTWLLDAIMTVTDSYIMKGLLLPEVLKSNRHVINGCDHLRNFSVLNSEYFKDLRGRMYQFCHYGPNPQGADMAKALCYHTVVEEVYINTPAFEIFQNEFYNEVVSSDYWADEKVIRRVAANPAGALSHALSTTGDIPFKKFFTYMDMCKTWVEFQDKGVAVTQLGFGPDAKCSGAQILSILAGSRTLAKACGLTSDAVRTADPYVMSVNAVDRLVKKSTDVCIRDAELLTRGDIKTPFMAIQYGGGVPSLRYKKFEPIMGRIGVPSGSRDSFCKDYVIEGIKEALGTKVNSLIEGLRGAALEVLTITGKDYFNYRHIDGFLCTKKGDAKVRMTDEPFMINFGETGKQAVIFGSLGSETKSLQGWMIDSNTIGQLQAQNFVHYFPVHFIQGLDAVMAGKIALEVKRQGLRGYSTIHDQFRVCLSDAPKMRNVVANVYKDMFIDNNPLLKLQEEMSKIAKCDIQINVGNPLVEITKVVTEEILYSENAYYFE